MYVNRQTVALTTNGSGAATGYTEPVNGRVLEIVYVKTDFADGSTMTVTGNTTSTPIWAESAVNASATRAPRQATHGTTGTAATYDATRPVLDYIPIADERIKIVIAAGGDTKTGTFYITVG